MPIRLQMMGIPEARHQPITHFQAENGKLVPVWPKRYKLAHMSFLMAPLKPALDLVSSEQHMLFR